MPSPKPCATLAATVAAIPRPSSQRANAGNRRLTARGIKHHDRTCVDQAVYRQRDQASSPARLTMRSHEVIGMLIGRDRGHRRDAEHGKRRRPPGDPIPAAHRTPSAASANSVVSAIPIVYVRCDSGLGHKRSSSDLPICHRYKFSPLIAPGQGHGGLCRVQVTARLTGLNGRKHWDHATSMRVSGPL
jgi:hypothetical protein